MKKALLTFVFFTIVCIVTTAQTDIISKYKKTSAMIPMRDGVKLYTVVLSPVDAKTPMPILMQRTPIVQLFPYGMILLLKLNYWGTYWQRTGTFLFTGYKRQIQK